MAVVQMGFQTHSFARHFEQGCKHIATSMQHLRFLNAHVVDLRKYPAQPPTNCRTVFEIGRGESSWRNVSGSTFVPVVASFTICFQPSSVERVRSHCKCFGLNLAILSLAIQSGCNRLNVEPLLALCESLLRNKSCAAVHVRWLVT